MNQKAMFENGEDLPLFSGTPQRAQVEEFKPAPQAVQPRLFRPLMGGRQRSAWDRAKERVQGLSREEIERRLEACPRGTLERNALQWRLTHLESGGF